MSNYIPERGDLVWIDMNPQAGHEQAGRRPAIVLSPRLYNGRVGLALCCPVTSQVKGYPFEVPLPESGSVTGVVLADQLKSLDWKTRNASFIGSISKDITDSILEKTMTLLQ